MLAEITNIIHDPYYRSSSVSLAAVANIVADKFAGDIVEIGGGIGETTAELIKVAKRLDRTVILIDPYDLGWDKMPYSYGLGGGYLKESLMSSVDGVDGRKNFQLIQKSSMDVSSDDLPDEICFTFVDGLQSVEAVLNDLRLVSKSIVIAVDDFKRYTDVSQVAAAVEIFMAENPDRYHMVCDNATVRSRAFLLNKDLCGVVK
jgi:hypothetical protein